MLNVLFSAFDPEGSKDAAQSWRFPWSIVAESLIPTVSPLRWQEAVIEQVLA